MRTFVKPQRPSEAMTWSGVRLVKIFSRISESVHPLLREKPDDQTAASAEQAVDLRESRVERLPEVDRVHSVLPRVTRDTGDDETADDVFFLTDSP